MILGTGCLGARALDGAAITAALEALHLDHVLLVTSAAADPPSGLAGLPAVGVRASWADRQAGVDLARSCGALRLVLDLPDDAEVDTACRALFEQARANPGLGLALLTPAGGALASPAALQLVLDDLASLEIGYWHVPSRSHRLGLHDVDWFDAVGRHAVGLSLDDVLGEDDGLPPGTGELDLGPVSELGSRSLQVTLDTGPIPDVTLLKIALRDLQLAGFR